MSDRSNRIERAVLYFVVLVLAIAVGVLAFVRVLNGPVDDCVGCKDLTARLDAIDAAIGGVGETFTNALDDFKQGVGREVEARVGALIAAHSEETTTALGGVNATVAKTIADSLAGLEGRVADAVSDRLLAAGCTLGSTAECPVPPPCPPVDDCDDGPPTMKVESRFTFLYENARLNEDRKVTRESVGVKLAPRHLKRLELLTGALRPCHRPDDPVKFAVAGYSSTAEFRTRPDGGRMSDSDGLNLLTANLRAQIVVDYLRAQDFDVATEEWRSTRDMRRPYLDDGQEGTAQQALNRTVFVELKSAGACNLGR